MRWGEVIEGNGMGEGEAKEGKGKGGDLGRGLVAVGVVALPHLQVVAIGVGAPDPPPDPPPAVVIRVGADDLLRHRASVGSTRAPPAHPGYLVTESHAPDAPGWVGAGGSAGARAHDSGAARGAAKADAGRTWSILASFSRQASVEEAASSRRTHERFWALATSMPLPAAAEGE